MLTHRAAGSEDIDANEPYPATSRPGDPRRPHQRRLFPVAITLLAVDDSVTMRKVLEITFAGPEFKVVTANSPDAALQKLKTDKPDLVISDITLEPKNGYELCKAIKQVSTATPVLLLSSKQNPFDPAKGTASQADDHMDKPFDTQQMIDKVKKMLQNKADTSVVKQSPLAGTGVTAPAARPPTSPAMPVAAAQAAAQGASPARAKTLIYNPPTGGPGAGPPAGPGAKPAPPGATPPIGPAPKLGGPSPTPPAGIPKQQPRAPATIAAPTPPPPTAVAAVSTSTSAAQINGQMAAKLEGLGLTPAQVDAVVALSREVVERVVWEVVPVLAETIIKEELARLTK
jgi:CheY-like chemotaxis protein